MSWRRRWIRFARTWFRRPQDDRDIEDELRFHVEQETELRESRGEAHDEAAHAARRALGSVGLVKQTTRDVWVPTAIEQLLVDLGSGCRILTRSPALAATAIVLVALVIGGNTTVFSIAHGILSRPTPGVQAADLVTLTWVRQDGWIQPETAYATYRELSAASSSVQPMLAYEYGRFAISHEGGTHAVWGASTSTNYFRTLGVSPIVGRTFTEEASETAAGLVAVISHRAWQKLFLGAADIVGTPITLNRQPATIVGVAAPPFRGTQLAPPVDVWMPLSAVAGVTQQSPVGIIGRLSPDRSLQEARTELGALWTQMQAADPEVTAQSRLDLVPHSATGGGNSLVAMQGDTFLAVFSVVTLLTLVIVCANVANLLVGRTLVRQRELAVRRSLGASRLRIVRMLLAEGCVLAAVACVVAWACAWSVSRVISGLLMPDTSGMTPPLVNITPDSTVTGYALTLALACTVIVTIAPALRAWRQPLLPWLKAGEQAVVPGRSRLSSGLVVLQLAFSVLLLTSAGLAHRSVFLLGGVDIGFDTRNLLLVTVNTAGSAGDPEANAALIGRLRARLQAVPGVETATYARRPPREFWQSQDVRVGPSTDPVPAETNHVGPDYLRVHRLSPLAGRELDDEQGRSVPPAIVTQGLATALWPGGTAVGRHVFLGNDAAKAEVVGVAPDAFFGGYRRTTHQRHVFLSAGQNPGAPGETTFYVRHRSSVDVMAPAIRRALREADGGVPIVSLRTVDAQLDTIIWPVRVLTTLLALFAGGSLFIAVIGQYAAVAFDTRRRSREFGLRLALGASTTQVLSAVLRDGFRLTIVGLAIGFALSLVVGQGLGGVLYGITPTDPLTYAGVFAVLSVASLVACFLPARRAGRVNPIEALRVE